MKNNNFYSRRTFIALLGTSTLAAASSALLAHRSILSFLEKKPALNHSLIPSAPGILSAETKEILLKLFLDIGYEWKLMEPSEIESRKIEFDRFIQAKTSQPPSYLGEYENAVEVLGQSFPFSISLETKIGHFRKYVIREFAELHLIVGGFKHFGYRNYFGHPGGPLTGHPYR